MRWRSACQPKKSRLSCLSALMSIASNPFRYRRASNFERGFLVLAPIPRGPPACSHTIGMASLGIPSPSILRRAHRACLQLARNGHAEAVASCLLLREERTLLRSAPRSEFDPFETSPQKNSEPWKLSRAQESCAKRTGLSTGVHAEAVIHRTSWDDGVR